MGIDVGSSTTHLVFSRIVMQRQGARLSSAYEVVEREVLGRSPILLTPYQAGTRIDTEALGTFFADSYRAAGVRREDIDTGALIVTGDAANKENAPAIAELFARESGRFVCATAGPHLEAVLAAHGSGAVARSRGRTVVDLDVGGGTTKVSVVRDGRILETAAFAAGARVVTFADDGTVNRIEEGARFAAETAGIALAAGRAVDRDALASVLAEAVASVIRLRRFEGLARDLLVTEPIDLPERIDLLIVSGGVSEYVYAREARGFGDLGPLLGAALAERLREPGMPALEAPDEGIRATVIGAGQYTVQLSGSTVLVSRPDLLPQRDLVVVRPNVTASDGASIGRAIARSLARARGEGADGVIAIALSAHGEPSHARLFDLASGIAAGTALLAPERPLVLVFDTDLGRSVGRILQEEVLSARDIIAIDEVRVADFDRIDIGGEVETGGAVPVVVKTLVFRTAPREMDG